MEAEQQKLLADIAFLKHIGELDNESVLQCIAKDFLYHPSHSYFLIVEVMAIIKEGPDTGRSFLKL